MRIGLGFDIHRLSPTVERASIPIGGVAIPCFLKVEAHSDGDVLLHALVDAMLGALALGDIGQWFPDNSEVNRGRPSSDFVTTVLAEVNRLGFRVGQVDAVLMMEEPRLAEHRTTIREHLARLLQVELSNVSVKAKTLEGLGPIGERKALGAHTVVTLLEIQR